MIQRDELFEIWAPVDGPWSLWAKPVLFSEMPLERLRALERRPAPAKPPAEIIPYRAGARQEEPDDTAELNGVPDAAEGAARAPSTRAWPRPGSATALSRSSTRARGPRRSSINSRSWRPSSPVRRSCRPSGCRSTLPLPSCSMRAGCPARRRSPSVGARLKTRNSRQPERWGNRSSPPGSPSSFWGSWWRRAERLRRREGQRLPERRRNRRLGPARRGGACSVSRKRWGPELDAPSPRSFADGRGSTPSGVAQVQPARPIFGGELDGLRSPGRVRESAVQPALLPLSEV